MIATPTKSESINYSISNNKIDLELSDNKIKTEHSLPKFSQTKQNLIKEDNLKESDANINTIHNSIISDNLEELEKLLKLGENPDIINKSGETPLYLSVDIENYDAMVILLEFGADCNIQKEDGYTPLHLAAEKKLDIYVCSLLSHGANPNIVNKTNLQSALHIGIINKLDEYVLSKFKENNGDIYNIKDKFDKSPFDYAINDEKYKNLLISIFDKNTSNNKNNDSLNIANNSNSNLDYYNFVSLSRNIHITNEDNNEINNNINDDNQNKDTGNCNSNIGEINNCLKKQLIFNSNSKDKDIASSGLKEQKSNKLIFSAASNSSGLTQNINNKSSKNNIINLVSDKGSNFSNNTYNFSNNKNDNDNEIENQNLNIFTQNNNINNLTEQEAKLIKSNNSTSIKKINVIGSRDTNLNFVLSSMNNHTQNNPVSHSLNLYNKISSIRANFSKYIKIKNNSNQTYNVNAHIDNSLSNTNANMNLTNTNGNISTNSYNNKKKDEGISELNPLDMINQMASSSNNSNIFSELQINSNTKKDGENSSKIQQTEEEFYNEENGNNEGKHNKIVLNEEYNAMKENISGNFSLNNNEPSNNKEINYINSLDDSLEYSKSKSFITSVLNSKDKNENNKDESFNIYNNNDNHIRNNNNKSIERYKNTTSNNSKSRSKLDYDMDSEHSNEKVCSISNSNISNIFNNNKQNNTYHYRQLSYHNNRQSSSNKNKSYNSSTNNSNKNNNKENIEPNINKTDNKIKIKSNINCDLNNIINDKSNNSVEKQINSKLDDINVSKIDKNNSLTNEEINRYSFPISTFVTKQRVYKSKNMLPEITREQKTKDSTLDDYFKLNEKINLNDTNNIFLNNTNYNSNYNEKTTNFLDLTNVNQFNTVNSENNSLKNNTRDTYNYSRLFKKALKKKYVIKEFSNSVQYGQNNNRYNKYNSNTDIRYKSNTNTIKDKLNSYKSNEDSQSQQISNELITRLRDWLISCDLLCYYNVLLKNNIFDIDSYINNLKNNKINISYKDIEDLGIKKPGHIFRFLLKLQMDIGTLDNKVCSYILNKFNENMVSTIGLNISVNEFKCCGMVLCPGSGKNSKSSNYSDIFGFLRNKDLMEFKENFIHNGFDQIEFVLIQLFSCFSFNKDILNDYFHIYSDNDKIKVIKKLYEEKRIISKELGLEYDEREVYNIINEQIEERNNSEGLKDGEKMCRIF